MTINDQLQITEPGGENPYAGGVVFDQDVAPPRGLLARVTRTVVRTGQAAIAWGRGQVTKPSQDWTRLCLMFVRSCFNVAAKEPNAGRAWDNAKFKHHTTDPKSIPVGVPVFFETPGEADHVALSLGAGLCLTNDWGVGGKGKIRTARIADISVSWGPLLGWTEDINGVRVYTAPKPAAKPKATPNIDNALADTRKAQRAHRTNLAVRKHLDLAAAELIVAQRAAQQ